AVAVWTQFDGTRMNVLANRYAAGSGWMGVETVDELDELVDNADVAIDASGDVLVVWQQSATGVVWHVMARRFTEANGWEVARHVSTTNVGQATSPQAAFDGAGNAVVLWLQNPGFDRAVYAARHTPTDGWLDPQMVGPGPGAEQHELDVA